MMESRSGQMSSGGHGTAEAGRLLAVGKTGGHLDATREHDVVGAGGNGENRLLKGNVAGAAGLGVVDGATAAHAKPLGHLHVGGCRRC